MTKKELLEKYLGQANHNLLCYSKNYGMTEPKNGFEKEWEAAKVELEMIEEITKLVEKSEENGKVKFVSLANEEVIGNIISDGQISHLLTPCIKDLIAAWDVAKSKGDGASMAEIFELIIRVVALIENYPSLESSASSAR